MLQVQHDWRGCVEFYCFTATQWSQDKELTISNLNTNNEKFEPNWITEEPNKVQSTVKFRGWNITTQASLHHLLDQQSDWDTDKVSSWRGHALICNSLCLDQDTQSEWRIHTSGYRTASGNELRIKSCFKLSMTEEGVLSSTVLQLCWGEFVILPKDSSKGLGWIQSRSYSGGIQLYQRLQIIVYISSRSTKSNRLEHSLFIEH